MNKENIIKEKYPIPISPFDDHLSDIDEQLRIAVSAITQLHTGQLKSSELVRQGCRTVIAEAAEYCTQSLSQAEVNLIEASNVLGNSADNERLAKLQNYSNEVNGLLVRLRLDAGLFGWRRSAALRTGLFVRSYGWQMLLLVVLAVGGLSLSKLLLMPAVTTTFNAKTESSETDKKISFVAVRAGQDLYASTNQTYEVFAEGTLLARKGSSGVARLGSTVVVAPGAQAEVYGIAYAYKEATVVLYPGGRVYAEPGANVDNRGGQLITLNLTDWPLRYRRI